MIRRLAQSTFSSNFARITRRSLCSSSKMTPYAVCYVTAPDETIAKKLSHEIITKQLAACVNIVPQITSVYAWEGKINEDAEVMLVIKTKKSRVDDLSEFIRANHPYSVAEVISMPIENGNPPYLDWIGKTVPEK
ncbi:protein CutA homolog isoform X2 [Culicoides brevitarsis]|uniref:protein CutA homolog isoform X2 n=1 Tax=Culicoides brevitarsis TaxID=469753 RepID=UPI00307BE49B